LELHANFWTFFLVFCVMMSGSTAKELCKDVEWVVEAGMSLRLLLLQSFLAIAVVNVLLFVVGEDLISYIETRY